jgi:hypothetical protein
MRNLSGKTFNRETLEIRFKGKSISDVLNGVDETVPFFEMIRRYTASKNYYSRCRFRIHNAGSAKAPRFQVGSPIKLAGNYQKRILETPFIFWTNPQRDSILRH